MARKKVLIAEDDTAIRYLMVKILDGLAVDIVQADDGVQAIRAFGEGRFDLVVLDISMPEMDGLEALAKIREIDESVPIILISVWKDKATVANASRYGITGYFQKPFNIEEVAGGFRSALENRTASPGAADKKPAPRPARSSSRFRNKTKMAKLGWGAALAAGMLAAGFFIAPKWIRQKAAAELPSWFRLPYPNPSGIANGGKKIWICDWVTQTVYAHGKNSSLSLDKFFPLGSISPLTLARAENALWIASADGTLHRASTDNLAILQTVPPGPERMIAMTWDGNNLWSIGANSKEIRRHANGPDMAIDTRYAYPGKNPVGMAWMGNNLWIAEASNGSLRRYGLEGSSLLRFDGEFRVKFFESADHRLSGLASDGKDFWMTCDKDGCLSRKPLSEILAGL